MEARPPPPEGNFGQMPCWEKDVKKKRKERKNKESGRRKIMLKIEVKG